VPSPAFEATEILAMQVQAHGKEFTLKFEGHFMMLSAGK
jgi:hypothetical protein